MYFDHGSGLLVCLSLLTVIPLAGCGEGGKQPGPTGGVAGVVTFEDQPVTEGRVQFYSAQTGGGGMATLDQSGKFAMQDPILVGSYKVSILPPEEPAPESPTGTEPKEYPNIPEKYRTELTTDLTAEVKEGDNQFTFDMKP